MNVINLKTFELVPVIDRVNPAGERPKTCIECFEQALENFYIGTSDCFLIHYSIEKGTNSIGKTIFVSRLQRNKQLGLKKPIKSLIACSPIGQLLVLCDYFVYSVSMYGLEFTRGSSREILRNVTAIARNRKPPVFSLEETQICVGTTRKTVQIVKLTNDECVIIKEINVPNVPSVLAIDSTTICGAFGNQYYLLDCVTSRMRDLNTIEVHNNVVPIVKRVGDEEFLLNGPSDKMATVVTSNGVGKQVFIWSDIIRSVAFSYPYILVLGSCTVTVYSVLDQKQKQTIPFTGGVLITDFDGQVFIAMQRSIMAFLPIPFNKQIQVLLMDKRIDEAFDLLLVCSKINPKQYNELYVNQVKAQGAFVYFADARFDKALPLFIESKVDPREIIVLYPLFMPGDSEFTASRPLLHNIKDLTVILKGSKSVFADAKKMLLKYLAKCRGHFSQAKKEIDTALLKLYAECNHSNLQELVTNENNIFVEEALSWLAQCKRFHCLALFQCYLKQQKQALEIWRKLIAGDIEDPSFPGLTYFVNFLSQLNDLSLVWSNSSFVLKRDQELGVKIFIERPTGDKLITHDQVCDFLQKYPVAQQIYLEFLVYEKASISQSHHTHLALIYVNNVVDLLSKSIKDEGEVQAARSKLQSLLETSSTYRVSSILQKISHYPLYKEIAVLYGKMDQHDKALRILVYQLKDFVAAERYCDTISVDKRPSQKQHIFFTLLQLYLRPNEESPVGPEHYVMPAVSLLNRRHQEFNMLNVLQILPDEWSVDLIGSFMKGALRHNYTTTLEAHLESNLRKQLYLQTKGNFIESQKGVISMKEEKPCDFCKKYLTEPAVARYPNGVTVHLHCARDKNVCPVTGRKFK